MDKKVIEYVKEKTKSNGEIYPIDTKEYLKGIEKKYSQEKYKLTFSSKRNNDQTRLNSNAGPFSFSPITATSQWAYLLTIERNDKLVNQSFAVSIGHEISHKRNDIKFIRRIFALRFLSWCNEVYADYYGVKLFGNSKQEILVKTQKYKEQMSQEISIDDVYHPSRQNRIKYAETFSSFDEPLIREIAKDAKCRREKCIKKAIKHYEVIELEPMGDIDNVIA